MPRRTFIALLATAIVVASCGGAEPPSRQVDTTIEAAVGTTITAVTTVAPGSSAQPTESTAIEPVEEWELVVFGDSFASKSGWPEQYAEMVGDEFGVAVSVGGAVCFGGCTGLDRIRGSDGLQAEIATAEFVVIQPQPGRVVAPLWRLYAAGDCGGDDGLACFRQAEADFRVYVEDLLDEVIELSGQGVVIRTMQATGTWALDSFHPGLRDSAPEQFDAFLENMLILSQHVAEAAADRCIGSVDVNAILSGPDYRQPVSPEHSNDGSHPSEEGSRVIAEALRTLGYESKIGDC